MNAAPRPVSTGREAQRGPLLRKLSNFLDLAEADIRILEGLGSVVERYPADTDIIHQGQMPRSVFLLIEGMACRYRNMQDGRRQIMTFLLPGDFCDVHGFLLRTMDHSISTLTPVKLISVPRNQLIQLMFKHPRIAAALWWCSLQEEAILRERIVALGRRNARGRVAYLLCELWWRYDAIGLTHGASVTLPLTQLEIADAIGLTPAHVNRVLMGFRDEDLINLSHRTLTLRNLPALQSIGDFNSDYLHLEGASAETAAYFDGLEHKV